MLADYVRMQSQYFDPAMARWYLHEIAQLAFFSYRVVRESGTATEYDEHNGRRIDK